MRRAKIGVIGAGWWATQAHIPSLRTYEKADLVGVADPDAEKLRAAATYYEVDGTFEDYRDLLRRVEGVVIAVPHAYHYEIARDALDAGVHVLVEKPMVLTADHAWDLVERARQKGLELMVGTTFQFTDRLLLRNIMEYNTFDRTLGANVLLTYRVNSGTVFYIGYDDRYQQGNLIFDDNDDPLYFTTDFERTNRAFFTKVSYLFRY